MDIFDAIEKEFINQLPAGDINTKLVSKFLIST